MLIVRFHTLTPDRYEPAATVTAELTHTFSRILLEVEEEEEEEEVAGSLTRPLTWTV